MSPKSGWSSFLSSPGSRITNHSLPSLIGKYVRPLSVPTYSGSFSANVDGADYLDPFLRHLVYAYVKGLGVKKSPENAKKLCEAMIEQGYPAGFLTMGEMYQQGVWGKPDLEKARECFQKGAAMGDEACRQALHKLNNPGK